MTNRIWIKFQQNNFPCPNSCFQSVVCTLSIKSSWINLKTLDSLAKVQGSLCQKFLVEAVSISRDWSRVCIKNSSDQEKCLKPKPFRIRSSQQWQSNRKSDKLLLLFGQCPVEGGERTFILVKIKKETAAAAASACIYRMPLAIKYSLRENWCSIVHRDPLLTTPTQLFTPLARDDHILYVAIKRVLDILYTMPSKMLDFSKS